MDTLKRRISDAASEYREFVEGNRRERWSPYVSGVVNTTESRLKELNGACPRYYDLMEKVKAEALWQIEVGLLAEPSISGKVVDVIKRPSSQGYPLGDPRNNDSIVIQCDKPRDGLTLAIPLMPEWERAEKGDYVKFFANDKYYRTELQKGGRK